LMKKAMNWPEIIGIEIGLIKYKTKNNIKETRKI